MATVQDPESSGINVRSLEAASSLNPRLKESIKRVDKNNDGFISADELVQIIQAEQDAVQSTRLLKKIIAALAVLLILNIAATAGLTYGIVYLATDTNVNDDNMLVSKSSGETVGSSTLAYSGELASMYNITDPLELAGIQHLILPEGDSYRIFSVTGMDLTPGVRLQLNTTMNGGSSIVVDTSGVFEVPLKLVGGAGGAAAGRRLLEQQGNVIVVLNGQVIRPRIPKSTPTPIPTTQAPVVQQTIQHRNGKSLLGFIYGGN
jgi:hypothetical protein